MTTAALIVAIVAILFSIVSLAESPSRKQFNNVLCLLDERDKQRFDNIKELAIVAYAHRVELDVHTAELEAVAVAVTDTRRIIDVALKTKSEEN